MYALESIAIETLVYVEPPEVVSSAEIEEQLAPLYQRLRLPEGRLELMTGIRERRFWPADHLPSRASAEAGRKALARSEFNKNDIDLLIHCGVCRDQLEPATASHVHGLLGMPEHCFAFDISNACLGWVNALMVAANMMANGSVRQALIVSGENGRSLLDNTVQHLLTADLDRQQIKPYFANLTIGGGAVAAILCAKDLCVDRNHLQLGRGIAKTDSSANHLCQGDSARGGQLQMLTDSEALLEAGVSMADRTWGAFQAQTGLNASSFERVICHQVGRQHQRALFDRLGIEQKKDFSTYPTWGNVGSVSLPLTLAKAIEEDALDSHDQVALMGIGSGLVCAIASLRVG